jgi:hypothetical protein
MSSTTSIPFALPRLVTGGDFAGFSATFVPTTGSLVPIPEYVVPKELLEWGQEPSSLETIVSEDMNIDVDDTDMRKAWSRQTVTVFPAVGCGIDNLHTQTQEQEWQTVWRKDTVRVAVRAAAAAVDPTKPQVWTVEASFGWNPEQLSEHCETSTSDSDTNSHHRVSMQVTATLLPDDDHDVVLQSPVHVRLERQTDAAVSSHGKIAVGGGLDGRQVSRLLGASLRSQSNFAAEPNTKTANATPAVRWEAAAAEDDSSSSVRLSERVHFPGNLTLAIGSNGDGDSAAVLEVGHITWIKDDLSSRQVVQCTLPSTGLPVVQSWTERGNNPNRIDE